MIIISHRGYWKAPQEKNTLEAFDRSFSLEFGTETDLRDMGGELVISHAPALEGPLSAETFFSAYNQSALNLPLALKIKADGLQKLLGAAFLQYQIQNYFVFDMAIPDMISYIKAGIKVFTRQSDFEPDPVLYEQSQGVWVDGFETDWVKEATIENHIKHNKKVCLVSPDLHGRPFVEFWEKLDRMQVINSADVMICTDHPEEARKFLMCKIKAVLLDMDGVLIDAKDWHYDALNKALGLFGMEISRYEHLVTYIQSLMAPVLWVLYGKNITRLSHTF